MKIEPVSCNKCKHQHVCDKTFILIPGCSLLKKDNIIWTQKSASKVHNFFYLRWRYPKKIFLTLKLDFFEQFYFIQQSLRIKTRTVKFVCYSIYSFKFIVSPSNSTNLFVILFTTEKTWKGSRQSDSIGSRTRWSKYVIQGWCPTTNCQINEGWKKYSHSSLNDTDHRRIGQKVWRNCQGYSYRMWCTLLFGCRQFRERRSRQCKQLYSTGILFFSVKRPWMNLMFIWIYYTFLLYNFFLIILSFCNVIRKSLSPNLLMS